MNENLLFPAINVEQHPNREVDLDEVREGEMVEDKLIIPEEFKNYLNQVLDGELGAGALIMTNNANSNVNGNDEQKAEQSRRANTNPENFNQWRNPQAYQMPSPLNQPQSPPLVPTPHTPASRVNDIWSCTQYQQAPPPYPNYYNQSGQIPSNATQMQCNYNGYSNTMNYGMMNFGAYYI